uniref:Uncharacterized protein n=1 Tax=Onchocerca volvulus TaxID=6282 RepID=A0A8R1TXX7_ONCVO
MSNMWGHTSNAHTRPMTLTHTSPFHLNPGRTAQKPSTATQRLMEKRLRQWWRNENICLPHDNMQIVIWNMLERSTEMPFAISVIPSEKSLPIVLRKSHDGAYKYWMVNLIF